MWTVNNILTRENSVHPCYAHFIPDESKTMDHRKRWNKCDRGEEKGIGPLKRATRKRIRATLDASIRWIACSIVGRWKVIFNVDFLREGEERERRHRDDIALRRTPLTSPTADYGSPRNSYLKRHLFSLQLPSRSSLLFRTTNEPRSRLSRIFEPSRTRQRQIWKEENSQSILCRWTK